MTVAPFVILAQGPAPWMGPSPDQLEFVRRIAESFFTMVAAIALGVPLIRLVGRRLERPPPPAAPPALSADATARLERIEQAVDSIAIEMERVSEAQRFAAKLLAEASARALPASAPSSTQNR